MNFKRPLLLASSSPRRQFLMKEAGFQFKVATPGIDESFPSSLPVDQIPKYLAEKKARVFEATLTDQAILTSDTVVILDQQVLNKPSDRKEAVEMLTKLSGKIHTVITAVCLLSKNKMDCFDEVTKVTFRDLTLKEVEFYVDHFKPFDKAGAYGAQECLPPDLNPCSEEEIAFLKKIDKLELIGKSTGSANENNIIMVKKIHGSYFNVMGLPIHKVYEHLEKF